MKHMKYIADKILKPPYAGLPWLIWFYVLFACLIAGGGVFKGELTGFDDHTRMVGILNWVNGAGWYDRTITRVNAPEGFQTIWSRIVDVPYALIILALQNLIGQHAAALAAAFIIPFAQLAVLFAAAIYFARPLLGRNRARLVLLFVMFTSVMNYKSFSVSGFHTGEVSHHAWYIILALVLYSAVARLIAGLDAIRMAAFACTLLLAVGIEAFPIIGIAFLMLALIAAMYKKPELSQRVSRAAAAATLGSLVLLPFHQPPAKWFDISFAEPSLLGPVIMAFSAFFFSAQSFILRQWKHRKWRGAIACIILGLFLFTGLVVDFPNILQGPAAALSPAERVMAFRQHEEAQPLFAVARSWLDFLGFAMPSMLALAGAIYAWRSTKSPRKRSLILAYGGFAFGMGAMTEAIARFYHHAMTTSCVWLAWIWQRFASTLSRNIFYALKLLLIFVLLGPFWMLLLPALDRDETWIYGVLLYPAKSQRIVDACHTKDFGAFLNMHYDPKANLVVPGADSSRLLFHSNLHIDFLNNYPSQNKFMDNEIFFGTQDVGIAKEIVLRHAIDLVAVCRVQLDHKPLQEGEEPMMVERLLTDRPPTWLKPVATGLQGYRLFEVDLKK